MLGNIIIKPMEEIHIGQVSKLLVDGFRAKFQKYSKISDEQLVLFFERILNKNRGKTSGLRMVALEEDKVVGSICLKTKKELTLMEELNGFPWGVFSQIGLKNMMVLFISLCLLEHRPCDKECYVEDVEIDPDYRGHGVGKKLIVWAQNYVKKAPELAELSLHVAQTNIRAQELYHKMSFLEVEHGDSWTRGLVLDEKGWDYMVWEKI